MYICTYIIYMHTMYIYTYVCILCMYVHIALMYGYVGDMWSCGYVHMYVHRYACA